MSFFITSKLRREIEFETIDGIEKRCCGRSITPTVIEKVYINRKYLPIIVLPINSKLITFPIYSLIARIKAIQVDRDLILE